MSKQNVSVVGWIFILLAVIIVCVAVLSVFHLKKDAYAGYVYGGYDKIARIEPDSPAEHAGMKVGDAIKTIDGIEPGDTKSSIRRPSPKIGETRTFVVERDGEQISLDITYSVLPQQEFASRLITSYITGICFLVCGLLVYFKIQSRVTTLFAVIGLGFGFGSLNHITIDAYPLSILYGLFNITGTLLFITILLHFVLLFPKPKSIIQKKHIAKILYIPALIVILFFLYLLIVQPEFTKTINLIFQGLVVAFFILIFLLIIIVLIHSFVKSSNKERREAGLNIMLAGTLIAIVPMIFGIILQLINPSATFPGEDYMGLLMVFIPLSWAWAVLKKEGKAQAV